MKPVKLIPITKEEMESWPSEPLVKLQNPFIDRRGSIQPLVDLMMQSAVMIESKAGSLRANHYHKTDWHYCYVISGQIQYFYKNVNSNKMPEMITVKEGNMVFTPPLVEHCMKFPEDTIFLTLSRNPRDQETYEADVVRVNLIDPSDSISWKPNEE
tara:strand:- start:2907 stop:3374 length:468 start_codon:yes stop_codon:yes gene_type:complete